MYTATHPTKPHHVGQYRCCRVCQIQMEILKRTTHLKLLWLGNEDDQSRTSLVRNPPTEKGWTFPSSPRSIHSTLILTLQERPHAGNEDILDVTNVHPIDPLRQIFSGFHTLTVEGDILHTILPLGSHFLTSRLA
jgi:hypothetical protein